MTTMMLCGLFLVSGLNAALMKRPRPIPVRAWVKSLHRLG